MDKKQKEARQRQEDTALNRALLWVGGAIVLEVLLLLVNRYYINFRVPSEVYAADFLRSVLSVVRTGGGIAGIAALIWSGVQFKRGGKFALPLILALALGALTICAHVTLTFHSAGVQMLFLLVPAWAGLALVYYLYHAEFFLSAAALGMSALGLWFVRTGSMLEAALLLAGTAVITAAAFWLQNHHGSVRRANGETLQLLSAKTSYKLLLANCLGAVIALAAAMVLGSTAAYYLIFVLIAWLFALLVYYTVKLI